MHHMRQAAYKPRIQTFPRTLKESINTNGSIHELRYKNKPQPPQLGNLATHTKEHAGLIERREAETKGKKGQDSEERDVGGSHTGFMLASAKLMEKYVQDGLLNPRVEPTQPGFTRLFSAWLIEQDLAFTTGTFIVFLRCLLKLTTSNRGMGHSKADASSLVVLSLHFLSRFHFSLF